MSWKLMSHVTGMMGVKDEESQISKSAKPFDSAQGRFWGTRPDTCTSRCDPLH